MKRDIFGSRIGKFPIATCAVSSEIETFLSIAVSSGTSLFFQAEFSTQGLLGGRSIVSVQDTQC